MKQVLEAVDKVGFDWWGSDSLERVDNHWIVTINDGVQNYHSKADLATNKSFLKAMVILHWNNKKTFEIEGELFKLMGGMEYDNLLYSEMSLVAQEMVMDCLFPRVQSQLIADITKRNSANFETICREFIGLEKS